MKAMSIVVAALLLAAPAVGICACPKASTPKAPMGCEGTSHCCCGDSPAPSSEDCPRAEKSVDAGEVPENSPEARATAPLFPAPVPAFSIESPAFVARPEGHSRASPPSRPEHLLLTALLL
ncbi:MAG TPA: hypothetical protein VF950_08885 [Planctomycetota bacterium]